MKFSYYDEYSNSNSIRRTNANVAIRLKREKNKHSKKE